MSAGLVDFYHHNLWANLAILDACEGLTDEQLDFTMDGVFGSIRQTLMHMFGSEEGYVRRHNYAGATPVPPLKEVTGFAGFDELKRRAERSGKELIAVVEQADLDEVLHLDDGAYDAKLIIVMMQAINHGIDHRSQISTLMTLQGVQPPSLDAWSYNDSLS